MSLQRESVEMPAGLKDLPQGYLQCNSFGTVFHPNSAQTQKSTSIKYQGVTVVALRPKSLLVSTIKHVMITMKTS